MGGGARWVFTEVVVVACGICGVCSGYCVVDNGMVLGVVV